MKKMLSVRDLKIHFPLKKSFWTPLQTVYAVDGISFDVIEGEILGIVGESGCGKSSLARALVGLNPITAGEVYFDETLNLAKATSREWRQVRHAIQFIFQDPVEALNPRMTVAQILSEPLLTLFPTLPKSQLLQKVLDVMKLVGLSPEQLDRYPQEFSGGQCQRIGIARALIVEPKVLICDESVSALDVSIKAQIINLLQDLQRELKLTILFISHDLSIVKHLSNRILVMYLGHLMELGDQSLCDHPLHPYTQALLSAVPHPSLESTQSSTLPLLEGELPSPLAPPTGCVFNTRCPLADLTCQRERPQPRQIEGRTVACFKV